MASWLKKKWFNAGPGSPGKTAKVMANNYQAICRDYNIDGEEAFIFLVGQRVRSWHANRIMSDNFTSESLETLIEKSEGDLPLLTYYLMSIESKTFRNNVTAHQKTFETATEVIYENISDIAPSAVSKTLDEFQYAAIQFSKNYDFEKNRFGVKNTVEKSSEVGERKTKNKESISKSKSNAYRQKDGRYIDEKYFEDQCSDEDFGVSNDPLIIFEETISFKEFEKKYNISEKNWCEDTETGEYILATDTGQLIYAGESLELPHKPSNHSVGYVLEVIYVKLVVTNIITNNDQRAFLENPDDDHQCWVKSHYF
ncbi:hypothetical protein LQ318_07090 [Aliifodinibius salicampi]|uniref:Uncharacterized protein n=1 Tax=Fodinibius salicampi TaxID=1920655 RepID=A0ABT3PXT1_9BACT|nr:hypothetical protein [Fodinibius salicampi]MCW9712665.1 hypothetical protein [Fodinibius salicampi]